MSYLFWKGFASDFCTLWLFSYHRPLFLALHTFHHTNSGLVRLRWLFTFVRVLINSHWLKVTWQTTGSAFRHLETENYDVNLNSNYSTVCCHNQINFKNAKWSTLFLILYARWFVLLNHLRCHPWKLFGKGQALFKIYLAGHWTNHWPPIITKLTNQINRKRISFPLQKAVSYQFAKAALTLTLWGDTIIDSCFFFCLLHLNKVQSCQ